MSQLDLACEAGISTRHLSFLETGRSLPSRDMVLHLAEQLRIPLRERNVLLVSAGYAPLFPERHFDDPAFRAARRAVDLVLKGHEPYPALAIDRHWTLVAANSAVERFLGFADPSLLHPPVNVLRLSLHPQGLAPRIANLSEWRAYLLERLRAQIEITADKGLVDLMKELHDYPLTERAKSRAPGPRQEYAGVVMPFQVVTEEGTLSFFSTTTIFGTPVDITLSELAIESFLPADAETADALLRRADKQES
jgi:transcriptional regulator with XRE-family HTH domain